jgi:ATP-dependent Clp protease ATP-binding subunit ClpB
VLEEVAMAEGSVILFIDEIHTVLGAGSSGGAMDAANILKPMLARGELKCVGATTNSEYQARPPRRLPPLLRMACARMRRS